MDILKALCLRAGRGQTTYNMFPRHKGLSYLSQVSNSAASALEFSTAHFVGEFDDKQLMVGIKKDFGVV